MNDQVAERAIMGDAIDNPLVTFVLFAYNQEAYIRDAIAGALAQSYEPLEIIISDDCSSDRTFEIMEEMVASYSGPHLVRLRRSATNLGLSRHINECVRDAKGTIITWAAGDDIALPERTRKLVQPMLFDRSVYGVHSSIIEIDENGQKIGERQHPESVMNIRLSSVCSNGVSVISQAHAFRREVFDLFGGFRGDLTNEGPVMAFRESILGSVVFVNSPTTLYRIGSGTSTYSGHDIDRVKISEPVKISNWRRTAFLQMLDDADRGVGRLRPEDRSAIEKNAEFFSNLWHINKRDRVLRMTLKNILIKPGDSTSLRAMFRVLIPRALFRLAKRVV